jgi:hypothetical protein
MMASGPSGGNATPSAQDIPSSAVEVGAPLPTDGTEICSSFGLCLRALGEPGEQDVGVSLNGEQIGMLTLTECGIASVRYAANVGFPTTSSAGQVQVAVLPGGTPTLDGIATITPQFEVATGGDALQFLVLRAGEQSVERLLRSFLPFAEPAPDDMLPECSEFLERAADTTQLSDERIDFLTEQRAP